jgi:hypothetical protein
MPSSAQAEGHVVRVNDGLDSHVDKGRVILATAGFCDRFFNTSWPDADFPGPVVVTINPGEKTNKAFWTLGDFGASQPPQNLMFVRFRVTPFNEVLAQEAVNYWTKQEVPLVFVFMAYTQEPVKKEIRLGTECESRGEALGYVRRKRTRNEYWAVDPETWASIMYAYRKNDLVYSCGEGMNGSIKCAMCGNCLRAYFAAKERMLSVA